MERDSVIRSRFREKKLTHDKSEFLEMRRVYPERLTILSEGDSWFAYPHKNFVGQFPNLIDHISGRTRKKASFLNIASNGAEAVEMISGKQKHNFIKVFNAKKTGRYKDLGPVDLLLFSGGGNDVVGENDFEMFLKRYQPRYVTGEQCLHMSRVKRKVKLIGAAYHALLDMRDHFSKDTVIITHTFAYPFPSLQGARFLGGFIETEGWMKRFMDKQEIPDDQAHPENSLQFEILKIIMDSVAVELMRIAETRKKFIVVDTRRALPLKTQWLNELHPTRDGFEIVAEMMFRAMTAEFPELA